MTGRGVFITGTDTGVGKTVVAGGILRCLRERGLDAVPMKPVQTGAERHARGLTTPDLDRCLEAAGMACSAGERRLMSPYVFEPACSPHLAGRLAGHFAEIAGVRYCLERLLERHQTVVVEGAGGVMCPLNETATMLELMKALGLPVLLVAWVGLGTINHTLLSLEALRRAGLDILGVVFNQVAPPREEERFIEEDNPRAVGEFGRVPVFGPLRYREGDGRAAGPEFQEDLGGLIEVLARVGGP